ncbi:MAG: choice-of-anchor R domain-containing protein [Chloroflexota bacterium]
MNQPLTVQWFLRDDTPCLPPPYPLRVERLVWEEPGGAALAVLRADLTAFPVWEAAEWAADALRRPLVVYSPEGEACWSGFVARAEILSGRLGLAFDLNRMANRVAAVFPPPVSEPPFPPRRQIGEWAEDALSLQRYGRKEHLLPLNPAAAGEALTACRAYLQGSALPQGEPFVLAGSSPPALRLLCRGWFSTLNWSYLRVEDGAVGFVAAAQTSQTLGRSASSDAMLAQSFQTAFGPFYLLEAGLNLKRYGTPADGVTVTVCADQNGAPGAALAAQSLPAGALSGGRAWARFVFPNPPQLLAATPYWLRIERSGALNSTHYYQLYRETNDPYPGGRMLQWNGSAWVDGNSGLADLNFYILAGQSRSTRLLELTAPQHGGQFLRGVCLRAEPGGLIPCADEGVRPCGAVLLELLSGGDAQGRPLRAQVNAARELIIEPLPEAENARWLLHADGALTALSGRPARLSEPLAGEWARLPGGGAVRPLFLRRVEWTAQEGLRASASAKPG